ncbi:MAG TPA: hypothetical protein DCM65_03930 [Acinetobacter junii]|nr:hypothetical protein [Acinetobacter junii]
MKESPDETEQTKKPTWLDYVAEGCGELVGQLVLFGAFFLITNVYFAYVAFGVGALFLILPFAMLIYYAAKKYVQKQKAHDKNHKLSEK